MGLKVTGYCGIEPVVGPRLDERANPRDVFNVRFYWAPRHIVRTDGMDMHPVYRYRNSFEFDAGTYAMHNIFCEQLAELAGYGAIPLGDAPICYTNGAIAESEGPFRELIDFSRSMGTIGPRTAGKLADDFARYMNVVEAEKDPLFGELFRNWFVALTIARLDGALQLH
ncbi:hypothetical protein [Burkholderia cenocepacia]|uniref:hypothetical protein n=1 Tax=Burkholderia cenocepacia TaxID=95486 RepID=UPI0022324CAB|nr:hypothetical protein [Burkholderia cenocepacia]MCW3677810.1 hypothetical protein [Burkholderia cenocepacia]